MDARRSQLARSLRLFLWGLCLVGFDLGMKTPVGGAGSLMRSNGPVGELRGYAVDLLPDELGYVLCFLGCLCAARAASGRMLQACFGGLGWVSLTGVLRALEEHLVYTRPTEQFVLVAVLRSLELLALPLAAYALHELCDELELPRSARAWGALCTGLLGLDLFVLSGVTWLRDLRLESVWVALVIGVLALLAFVWMVIRGTLEELEAPAPEPFGFATR